MTKNASQVVVRHNLDNIPELNLITMLCCIVLSVVIVLILLIFIAFIVYVVSQWGKHNQNKNPSTRPSQDFSETLMNASRAVSNSYKREITPRGSEGVIPNSVFEGVSLEGSSNSQQHIPLSTFKTEADGSRADSSASSAGLCDVLFPPKHDGEVILEPPPRLVTFAGRVYASPTGADSNSEPGSSTVPRRPKNVSGSLEWDYYESRRYGAASTSDATQSDRRKAVDISWV